MSQSVQQLVGQRVRAAREARGWSQAELGRRVNRSQGAIAQWESGRRTLGVDDLVLLAGQLGLAPADFFSDASAPGDLAEQIRREALFASHADLVAALLGAVDVHVSKDGAPHECPGRDPAWGAATDYRRDCLTLREIAGKLGIAIHESRIEGDDG